MTEMTTEAVEWSCAACGVTGWMPKLMSTRLLDTGATFYCLNGHVNTYADTNANKLKRAQGSLEFTRRQRDAAIERENHLERRLSAAKGRITKLKNKYEPPTPESAEEATA